MNNNATNVKFAYLVSHELPWFTHLFFEKKKMSDSTKLAYAYELNNYFYYLKANDTKFSDKKVTEIEAEDLREERRDNLLKYFEYKKSISNGMIKNSSLIRSRSCLYTFWNFYISEGSLEVNPLIGITFEKSNKIIPNSLNAKDSDVLLNAVKTGTGLNATALIKHEQSVERDYALMSLLFETGIMPQELVKIKTNDYDEVNCFINISERNVSFPLSTKTSDAIKEYINVREDKYEHITTDSLFVNKYGQEFTIRSVERLIKKYTDICFPGEKVTANTLRSTYIKTEIKKGTDIYTIKKQLGQKCFETTLRYAASE